MGGQGKERRHNDFGREKLEREERARLGGDPDSVAPVTDVSGKGVGFAEKRERHETEFTEHRPGKQHSDVGRG